MSATRRPGQGRRRPRDIGISRGSARQPFEPDDVVQLLDAAIKRGDDQLADLIRLGMWTGCRIEELCALKVEQVKDDHFSLEDAKTKAGWRDVPIHRELAQTMTRLIEDSVDGYVLSVRRHINWNNQRPDLKEDLAHLV